MSNTFGDSFKLSVFGDSHGKAIGGIIDGMIPGFKVNLDEIQNQMNRRLPASTFFSSPRKETDVVEFLSGLMDYKTTGGPIGFIIQNSDVKSKDYKPLESLFRPGHADFTYFAKYGSETSAGRLHASGRLFAAVVAGGSLALQFLKSKKIVVSAYVRSIGDVNFNKPPQFYSLEKIDASQVRCPDAASTAKMLEVLKEAKENGNSLGGVISVVVKGIMPGLGDPVFGKLQAMLAHAMFSIPSAKGFEYGMGFASASMKGSQHNDSFIVKNDKVVTAKNLSGGILGGISTGEDIYFNVAFKPISGIKQKQTTLDRNAATVEFETSGRHDVCMVPRAVPIVAAMTGLVLMDSLLKNAKYV